MSTEPVAELVSAALQITDADGANAKLDHYLRWNMRNMLHDLHPDDLNTDELMAVNAVLAQAMSRKLAALDVPVVPTCVMPDGVTFPLHTVPTLRVVGSSALCDS